MGDPIIVEDTAELDRALESGHVTFEHARAERYQSDPGNDTSSDPEGGAGDSESSSSFSSQPKSRAGSHSPQPRPLQESSRTRCMVLILVKNDFAACRITTSRGIARLHKPLNGKSTLPPHFLRSNPEQHQQQEGASPSNNARTRPQRQQRAGTDAVAARLPDMTGLTSAVASEGFTLIYRSSAGGMPLRSTVVVAPDTLHRSGRRPSCC